MSSPIPVKNIYYLLSYAWDRLPESEVTDVSGLESTELVDLFAAVLSGGINPVSYTHLTLPTTPYV